MRIRPCRSLGLPLAIIATWSSPLRAQPAQVAPDPPSASDAPRIAELSEKVRAIVEAYSNSEPVFLPDGKRVVFTSNRDGLPQLYLTEPANPRTAPVRITRTTERVTGPLPLPDGQSLLYRSDQGADENWSIFRVGIDGSTPVDLTPGEKLQRDGPVISQGAPDTMFFSARKMSEPASALYVQTIDPGEKPRRIFGESTFGVLVDVSPDGKQALWLRVLSHSETYVSLIDLKSGAARLLHPAGGEKVRVTSAAFGAEGKTVYIASDESGGTRNVVLALDPVAGKEVARYVEKRPATGLIAALCPSEKASRLAASVTAGDHHELRLLDTETLKPAASVKLPVGSGSIGACPQAFSPDGKRLLISWSTPEAPFDLYGVDAGTGRASPLLKRARPALPALPPITTSVVEIKAFDGGRIPMLVYRPRGVRGKLPVIVSYHGGPAGVSTARWSAQIRFFTSLGYAYVEPNVRGSTGYGRPFEEADNGRKRLDAFKDIETSASWVAAQPWADKDRMVIFGGSYGGYSTLIGLTRQPHLWRAGVNLFGVADVRTLLKTTTGVIRDIFKLEFGELGKDDDMLASLSPIRDVDNIVDPLFVYAGANDPRVPRSESDMIVAAVRKKGVPVEYMVKNNEGHSLARKENQIEFYSRAARFLEKHLALPSKQAAESLKVPKG
jgi:dipeptidyl aminopeptidase/acylaminoacyl peptidase